MKEPVRPVRLLVVDDSAVMRQTMMMIGGRERDLEVAVAADPLIAQMKIAQRRPDVILLDIEMPRMDGLTFLRKLMHEDPIPVVIFSALAKPGTDTALRALEEGALDIVGKPSVTVHESQITSSTLLDIVRAAATAKVVRRGNRRPAPARLPVTREPLVRRTSQKIVAIGASTGGTEALREILEALPPDAPGIVIVQHMPEVFTAAFANRLNATCRIEVKEAADGDRIIEGRALIAPGNRHLTVCRNGAEYRVSLHNGPPVSRHRPSVDVMFNSVAVAAGSNAIGVILTGMGADGAEGLLAMRNAGAATVAQDEASCIVFGMPREAIHRGAAQYVQSLHAMPTFVVEAAARMRREA